MKIWTAIYLLNFVTADEKILSRKKRIDEVNEDYDQKAAQFEVEQQEESSDDEYQVFCTIFSQIG